MDENRPTKKIKTPIGTDGSGHEVEIKEWIIGSEVEYIEEPLYDMVSGNAGIEGKPEIKTGNVSRQITESNHRAITTFVVSIDGSTENILERVLKMRQEDYVFILAEIEAITKPKKKEE
ncbi:MAG: hypothetical protein PHN89_02740 [Candidatus Pacebacteria bacterium]|nr:hypothetical protein [Candidatus Paceibacterota bacterium]